KRLAQLAGQGALRGAGQGGQWVELLQRRTRGRPGQPRQGAQDDHEQQRSFHAAPPFTGTPAAHRIASLGGAVKQNSAAATGTTGNVSPNSPDLPDRVVE